MTENLGSAERIIESLIQFRDHMVHNRPGVVVPDARTKTGVRWEFARTLRRCPQHPSSGVTSRKEDGRIVAVTCDQCGRDVRRDGLRAVFRMQKGKPMQELGLLHDGTRVINGGREVGEYRTGGLFPEVAVWLYNQVAEVWYMNNELAARWASHAYREANRDLKIVLAAFMLVQSRRGDPVMDGDRIAFYDEDYRDVGEAMVLLREQDKAALLNEGDVSMRPKDLLTIREVLRLPQVAAKNRELGFARSARTPQLGRWPKAVERWLRYREQNPAMLAGLVKAGYRNTVIELCYHCRYKPMSPAFYKAIGWTQRQARDGRRSIAVGEDMSSGDTWQGLTEEQICERIVKEKPSYKRLSGLLPADTEMTKAMVLAALEAGGFSHKDVIIMVPTFEKHGILNLPEVKEKLAAASRMAEDMRAANIAKRVRSEEAREQLEDAADNALINAVEDVAAGLHLYVFVDVSASMERAIDEAKSYLPKFLQAFPEEQMNSCTFNQMASHVIPRERSAVGVQHAFRNVKAGGGTDYGSPFILMSSHKPQEGRDSLVIFIGDEAHMGHLDMSRDFSDAVRVSGLDPVAFGLIPVWAPSFGRGQAVRHTATVLEIPCFELDKEMFEDVYAIPQMLRSLISSTPVRRTMERPVPARKTLAEKIMETELLKKPAWAA